MLKWVREVPIAKACQLKLSQGVAAETLVNLYRMESRAGMIMITDSIIFFIPSPSIKKNIRALANRPWSWRPFLGRG